MGEVRQSGEMYPVAGWSEALDDPRGSGAFWFSSHEEGGARIDCLSVVLPCNYDPMGTVVRLPIRTDGGHYEGRPTWQWDGNRERPTLSPSVHVRDEWHGFIRAGRFESC